MVKRKEVKIDEEQIRRVMAGDIPASVLENRYGSNAADSQKEDDKKPETENRSGIPAKSDKVEVPGSGVSGGEEEAPSPVLRGKTHRKKNSSGVSRTSVRQQRCERASADLCQLREL